MGRWLPGTAPNPQGQPKGFYSIPSAYADLLSWPREVVQLLADGKEKKIPPEYQAKLKPAHMIAVARWRSAMDAENRQGVQSAVELADRTSGPVVRQLMASVAQYLVEVPQQAASVAAWEAIALGAAEELPAPAAGLLEAASPAPDPPEDADG